MFAFCRGKHLGDAGQQTLLIAHPDCVNEEINGVIEVVGQTMEEHPPLGARVSQHYLEAFSGVVKKDLTRTHRSKYARSMFKTLQRAIRDNYEATFTQDGEEFRLSTREARAALAAPSTAVYAVEQLCAGDYFNGFCLVRPQGHLAGYERAGISQRGVVVFNNALVAAFHARDVYKLDRVAVVDFGPERGEGSESILHMNNKKKKIFYGSVFESPVRADMDDPNMVLRSVKPGASQRRILAAFEEGVFPALEEFQPQLIVLSIGFPPSPDGRDTYTIVLQSIVARATALCEGRLIALLELSSTDLRSQAGYVIDLLYAFTSVARPEPPAPSSTSSSEEPPPQYYEPPPPPKPPTPPPVVVETPAPLPPPPPRDTVLWDDPTHVYLTEEIRIKTAQRKKLKEVQAEVEACFTKHDNHEAVVDARCRELEGTLAAEHDTLAPAMQELAPHHAVVAEINKKISAEEERARRMRETMEMQASNMEAWTRLIRVLEEQKLEVDRRKAEGRKTSDALAEKRNQELKAEERRAQRAVDSASDEVARMHLNAATLDAALQAALERLQQTRLGMKTYDDELEMVQDSAKDQPSLQSLPPALRRMKERESILAAAKHISLLVSKLEMAEEGLADVLRGLPSNVEVAVSESASLSYSYYTDSYESSDEY